MTHSLDVAIVGVQDLVGEETDGHSPDSLMAEASRRALAEAGLSVSDVDAVFCGSVYDNMPALRLSETLGIHPRYMDSTSIGGSSFESFVGHAALALEAGVCDVALLAYGSMQRSDTAKFKTGSKATTAEHPYGLIYPISSYALVAQRHMAQFGTTPEQLAEVAVAASSWGALNPRAAKRSLLTIDDVLSSPMVSSPLHRLDCCLVTNGGGAIVLTRGDKARSLVATPIYVRGFSEATTHRYISSMSDLTVSAGAQSGPAALAMAGVQPSDVDVLQIYDAFTISVIVALEDLGFCKKGEGGEFVSGGRLTSTGALPLNTTGGGLSYCHPGMFGIFLLVEATRQMRGEVGGARQLEKHDVGLVHGIGGVMSSTSTVVLGKSTA